MINLSTTLPAPVKQVAHLGSRSLGRLTAPARMLPSFLICGGQRCGTTSLYRALAAHPTIVEAAPHRGVHYFDTNYHRGPAWYRAHFPLRRHGERILDAHGVLGQTFESSPYYLYHPHAAVRFARDLPGVRVIVLVRDPVERAYSHHAYEVAHGYEMEPDFARALALEPSRLRGHDQRLLADPHAYSFSHQHHAYTARGEYGTYLKQLAHQIGLDRMLVVEADEFFVDPKPVYDRVLEFLGVPHLGYPEFEQHNASPRPTGMPDEMRAQLTEHFAPHDAELVGWLGRTPTWRT